MATAMRDSYLIDGYNLLHALGMAQKHGSLEDARNRLLAFLAAHFDDATHVMIVFDAQHAPRHVGRLQVYHGLHVEFAPKVMTADDRIEELLREAAQPESLVVISNDSRVQTDARRRGARAWTHEELLDSFEVKETAPKQAPEEERPPVSPEETERWIKEFESLEKDPELKEFLDQDRFE